MRANVVLDDDLVRSALCLSGFKTKKKVIEEGLRLLIEVNHQNRIQTRHKFDDLYYKLDAEENLSY